MRVLVVFNPHATATTARERDVLIRALGSDTDLEVAETANRGHAAALACRAMRNGADAVVAFGGDGTVNEVVNGLLTDGVHERIPALGVIPAGSTNVFARALGLPVTSLEATGVVLAALRSGDRRAVSMGRADDRWFVFSAGMGLDAAVVGAVERRRRKGKKSTHLLYAQVGVREFFAADRRHPRLHVKLADGTCHDDIYFVFVTNTDPWTFVGNRALRPTPNTDFDHGLGMYARRRMGTVGTLVGLARMSGRDPKVGGRGAVLVEDLDGLTITADEPMPVQVDGDYLGLRDSLTFRTADAAIHVLV